MWWNGFPPPPDLHISSEAMLVVLYYEIGVLVGISKPWILAKAINQGFVSLKSQLLNTYQHAEDYLNSSAQFQTFSSTA